MDNRTRIYLQSIVGDYILEEKSFTMADLIGGRHLAWCREQADPENLVWISCSAEQQTYEVA